jgi:hypothetical protein
MKHIPAFESFLNESLNEGKMTINQSMDKAVRTPYGKGGPRTTIVLGKTSSGLAVTLNGEFVDTKKDMYFTNPTSQDKEEAQEMIQFHHDRLTGGINKEKLAALLMNMTESKDIINEAVNPEMDKKVKKFIKGIADDFEYSEDNAVMAVIEALKRLGHEKHIK